MKSFRLEITTPSGVVFADDAMQISVRAVDGSLAIMAGHIPIVTALIPDECRIYLSSGEMKRAECGGGILSVTKDKVQLISSTFAFK